MALSFSDLAAKGRSSSPGRQPKRAPLPLEDVMMAFKRARREQTSSLGRKRAHREECDLLASASAAAQRGRCSGDEIEELLASRLDALAGGAPLLESAMLERHVRRRLEEETDDLEKRLEAQLFALQATVADHSRRIEEQQAQLEEQARRLTEQTADLERREAQHQKEIQRHQAALAWQRQSSQAEYECLLLTMHAMFATVARSAGPV